MQNDYLGKLFIFGNFREIPAFFELLNGPAYARCSVQAVVPDDGGTWAGGTFPTGVVALGAVPGELNQPNNLSYV